VVPFEETETQVTSWWRHRALWMSIGLLLAIVALGGVLTWGSYNWGWSWTGFAPSVSPKPKHGYYRAGKTLWDLLGLLLVPIALAGAGIWFNYMQRKREERIDAQQRQTDMQDRQDDKKSKEEFRKDEALKNYLSEMTDLLMKHKLRETAVGSEVRSAAQARTLAVLPELRAERKGRVVQFLHAAGLIQGDVHERGLPDAGRDRVVRLTGSDLSGADLREAHLNDADLRRADLSGDDLRVDDRLGHRMTWSAVHGADLGNADLTDATLGRAKVRDAQLRDAILSEFTFMPNDKRFDGWTDADGNERSYEWQPGQPPV
jgi:hypothetical protein